MSSKIPIFQKNSRNSEKFGKISKNSIKFRKIQKNLKKLGQKPFLSVIEKYFRLLFSHIFSPIFLNFLEFLPKKSLKYWQWAIELSKFLALSGAIQRKLQKLEIFLNLFSILSFRIFVFHQSTFLCSNQKVSDLNFCLVKKCLMKSRKNKLDFSC